MISKPIEQSYLIDIIEYQDDYWDNLNSDKKVDLLILSPLPGSIISEEDIIVAASMFSIGHIDINNINILIDGKNITDKALITDNFLSISNLDFAAGDHNIIIIITNKFGMKYSPFKWSFTVKEGDKKTWFNKKFNQNVRYWSSYSHSNIDQNDIEYHNHNVVYDVDLSWLKLKSNIKISSLENIYEQSKLIRGMRVFHQKFGYGKIIHIEGNVAKVKFEQSTIKQIFIKYLKLAS